MQQEHGRISEETHYFTFGLKNAAISSRAFGKLQNKYGYQGDYAENDEKRKSNPPVFVKKGWMEKDIQWIRYLMIDELVQPLTYQL